MDSLREFEEVVVVDGGSKDRTEEIVKSYANVKFYSNPWPGFIEQRNFSIDQASHRWCFMIDSDEFCTPELREEMYRIINNQPEYKMYAVCRTEYFCHQEVEYGHGKSDYQERLFLRDHVRYAGGNHHAHLIDGEPSHGPYGKKVGRLPKNLRVLHNDSYSFDDWIRKIPRFAILIGNEKLDRGRKTNAIEVLATFWWSFLRYYVKSWRNGRVGFLVALSSAIDRCLAKAYIYSKNHLEERDPNYVKKNLG